MSVSAGNLLLRMVVTLLCILWLLAVVEGLNYYPNSVVQRASSRNAAWLLD
jgi:hypothetical protein